MTLKDGALVTHTGGSRPFVAHKESMEAELKRPITEMELYDRVHKKDKGKGYYVCPKAKKVRTDYEELLEETYPEQENRPDFDPILWSEKSGGSSGGRLYGFGRSQQPTILSRGHGNRSIEADFEEKFGELQKLVEELRENDEAARKKSESMAEKFERFQQDLPHMIRDMLRNIGFANNVYAGGSGHHQQYFVNSDDESYEDEDFEEEEDEYDDSEEYSDDGNNEEVHVRRMIRHTGKAYVGDGRVGKDKEKKVLIDRRGKHGKKSKKGKGHK